MARASLLAATSVAAATSLVASLATAAPAQATAPRFVAPAVIGGSALAARGTVVHLGRGAPPLPATTATAFLVADATTGQVLAARDAHGRLAPASTLKILTAVALMPRFKVNGAIKGSASAARTEGTRVGIVQGFTYRIDKLFEALLVMSANDAAVAISDAEGGLAPTLARMNNKAAQLQARDTVARTPNGLDAPGQTSSAYDLALIFRAGLAMPAFRRDISLRSTAFPSAAGGSYPIYTHDRLLASYPGMIGGKNGYTIAAHASFVGAARRGGHTIIVVVMRDVPDFWSETRALLDWGFAADGHVVPVGTLVAPRS
jgi:D-alanyl-D-alanine carboxypeptidase (penicillin-binding protein 5/6)